MRRVFLAALAFGCILVGCGGSGNTGVTNVPDPAVAFINASPNSTALDVFLNDFQLGKKVGYLSASPLAAGVLNFPTYEQNLYDMSVAENADPETQAIETATFNKDTSSLVVAIGLVTPPSTELDKRLRPVQIQFDRKQPNGNQARIIVIHAYNRSLGNDNPNLDFQNPGDNPTIKLTNIAFAGAVGQLIDAGAQTFVARRNGSELEVTPQTTFTFGAGKIYAAIISGIEGGTGIQAPQIKFIEIQPK